jgi:hypothetical protein
MISKLTAAAAFAFAFAGLAAPASAEDFPAAPLQAGAPRDLPGEALIPGARETADAINAVTAPFLQPILLPDGGAGAASARPAGHHRHHRVAAHGHHRHVAAATHRKASKAS